MKPERQLGMAALALVLSIPVLSAAARVDQAIIHPQADQEGDTAPPVKDSRPDYCQNGNQEPVRVQVGTIAAVAEMARETSIPVRVKYVCGLARFRFWVVHNPQVAQLVRVEPAPFLAGKPPVETIFVGLRPGVPVQTIAGARPPGSGTVDGVGTLARLIFRGVRQGITDVRLVRLQLLDDQGNEIPSYGVPLQQLTVLPKDSIGR